MICISSLQTLITMQFRLGYKSIWKFQNYQCSSHWWISVETTEKLDRKPKIYNNEFNFFQVKRVIFTSKLQKLTTFEIKSMVLSLRHLFTRDILLITSHLIESIWDCKSPQQCRWRILFQHYQGYNGCHNKIYFCKAEIIKHK